jgi:hypothetical protein
LRYDPLPMGISVEFKEGDLLAAKSAGWHAWSRSNVPGKSGPRVRSKEEVLIGFVPPRFLDFVRFERRSTLEGWSSSRRLEYALAQR